MGETETLIEQMRRESEIERSRQRKRQPAKPLNGSASNTVVKLKQKKNLPPSKWPDVSEDGAPRRTYRNARRAIELLGVQCSYDKFHDRMIVGGHHVNQWAGELSDSVNVVLRQAIIDHYGFDVGKENVADATTELCLENSFDPVLIYLDGLKWDGKERVGKWLHTYLGAEDNALNNAMGELTLIAAVRRVRKPGCKFDTILNLEGPEGTNKSTAILTMAGSDNFNDQTILSASDKEQQELVRGTWIYELADLAGMRRANVEKVKAFSSRQYDRARPAYGRRRVNAPRRCIFIGTTNEDEYLQSQTGNRRIWPVKTSTIDIAALERDRDQLWAEASVMEAKGEPLTLPQSLWGEALRVQDERRQHDPWDDALSNVDGVVYPEKDNPGVETEWVKSSEVLIRLGIQTDKATPDIYSRIRKVMKRLGWTAGRHHFGSTKRQRGYWRTPIQRDTRDRDRTEERTLEKPISTGMGQTGQ